MVTRARVAATCDHELALDAARFGNATVEMEPGEVAIVWRDIEEDPEHLSAALEVLRALAEPPHDGVYR